MSILIEGMEMPKGCAFCRIGKRNGKKMVCPLCDEEWDIHDPMSADHRLDNCLLVPVPPHGDLIDRREAIIDANERAYDFWLSDDEVNASIQFLKEQPTIIPAEEVSGNSGELENKP